MASSSLTPSSSIPGYTFKHLQHFSKAKLQIQPLVSINFWPGVYPLFPQSQAFPPPQRSVHLEMGQEPFMIHCTTKPAMPPMQQRMPSFLLHNRERVVMQNLLWDQATCSSPAKNTVGIYCIRNFSWNTSWELRKHPGSTHRAAMGLEMDQRKWVRRSGQGGLLAAC